MLSTLPFLSAQEKKILEQTIRKIVMEELEKQQSTNHVIKKVPETRTIKYAYLLLARTVKKNNLGDETSTIFGNVVGGARFDMQSLT